MANFTEEQRLFALLQQVIDKLCEEIHQEEYGSLTQEPALTAKIAAAIENELKHHSVTVGRLSVEVSTRNVPDRGRRSMERINGADLYISLVRRDKHVSKGMLLQAKWEDRLHEGDKNTRNQANRMRARSKDDSYILVYGPYGFLAVPARRATWPKVPDNFTKDGISLGALISLGLKCDLGDRNIGRDLDLPASQGMDKVLREISGIDEPVLELQVKRSVTSRMNMKAG